MGLRVWAAVTALFVLVNATLWLTFGPAAVARWIGVGPFTVQWTDLVALAVVWAAVGAALALLRADRIRTKHGAVVLSAAAAVTLYANVLRERTQYGDFSDYVMAAVNLSRGEPFHNRYLYPPFLASLLEPLLPLGGHVVALVLWTANILAVGVFVVLLSAVLGRYGFDRRLAALVAFVFVGINVPVLRTLGYIQVNLHVANLILLALWSYPRLPVVSALALALAFHLKVSPLVLALAFLLNRDWRWLTLLAAMVAAIGLATLVPHGWEPFASFVRNLGTIYDANGIAFRETSVDSLFRIVGAAAGVAVRDLRLPILAVKLVLFAAALWAMRRAWTSAAFSGGDATAPVVLDTVPALMVYMLLASPLLWEHHPVLVALPYLLMLKRLETAAEWVTYGAAYVLEFLLPTFDFFPWSFGRLLSPLLLLGLMIRVSGRTGDGTFWRLAAARFRGGEPVR